MTFAFEGFALRWRLTDAQRSIEEQSQRQFAVEVRNAEQAVTEKTCSGYFCLKNDVLQRAVCVIVPRVNAAIATLNDCCGCRITAVEKLIRDA